MPSPFHTFAPVMHGNRPPITLQRILSHSWLCTYSWPHSPMNFEWNETKREINHARHKIDLTDGHNLFDGRPVIAHPSPRDGELRFVTVGLI